jgi:hypothetical protein
LSKSCELRVGKSGSRHAIAPDSIEIWNSESENSIASAAAPEQVTASSLEDQSFRFGYVAKTYGLPEWIPLIALSVIRQVVAFVFKENEVPAEPKVTRLANWPTARSSSRGRAASIALRIFGSFALHGLQPLDPKLHEPYAAKKQSQQNTK